MASEEGAVRAVGTVQFSGRPAGQRCDYYSEHHEEPLEAFQPGSEHFKGICGCSLENELNLQRLNLFWPETSMNQSVLLVARLVWRPIGVELGHRGRKGMRRHWPPCSGKNH